MKRSEQIKERFFYLTGFLTLLYVAIQWYGFIALTYRPENYLPYQFTIFATIAIFGYTLLKETFRWTQLASREYLGEILTHIIIGSYVIMTLLIYFYPSRFLQLPIGFFDFVISIFFIWLGSRLSRTLYETNHK
ncbi:MAG: hypothetical protein HY445_02710 [Candidatus Niyogibacteria bacterium]|nr:hypothetical protein [Candidatus Niyogibacteria bacterium]